MLRASTTVEPGAAITHIAPTREGPRNRLRFNPGKPFSARRSTMPCLVASSIDEYSLHVVAIPLGGGVLAPLGDRDGGAARVVGVRLGVLVVVVLVLIPVWSGSASGVPSVTLVQPANPTTPPSIPSACFLSSFCCQLSSFQSSVQCMCVHA